MYVHKWLAKVLVLISFSRHCGPAAMNEENVEIEPNNGLADIDEAFITINYPCPSSHPPANNIWTVEHALDAAGVDAENKAAILAQCALSGWSMSDTFSATLLSWLVSPIAFTLATQQQVFFIKFRRRR